MMVHVCKENDENESGKTMYSPLHRSIAVRISLGMHASCSAGCAASCARCSLALVLWSFADCSDSKCRKKCLIVSHLAPRIAK